MPKLTAPLHLLQTALAAIKPYVSNDDVTPVITCVQLTAIEGGGVRMTATDRYQVGEIVIPSLTLEDALDGMLLDPIVTTYIRGVTKRQLLLGQKSLEKYTITLEAPSPQRPTGPDAGLQMQKARLTATLTNGEGEVEQMRSLLAVLGHFPPVHRMFPDDTWKPGITDIFLSPTFLANLSLTARALTGRPRGQAAVRFEFFTPSGAKKDRPVVITFDKDGYGDTLQMRVMIQPWLRTR